MANSLEYIRSLARIEPSPAGQGTHSHDSSRGVRSRNRRRGRHADADRWLAAARMVMELMEELQRQAALRAKQRAA
jgi:hypothetical protein